MRCILLLFISISSVICVTEYVLNEEGGEDEYLGNIPQDQNLPPLSVNDNSRTYQVLSGDNKVKITDDGDLLTRVNLDREKICPDNPPKCVVDAEIGVTQGRKFDLIKVQLVLNDINDNTPSFPHLMIEKEISESAAVGSEIRLDSATDQDLQSNSIQNYKISSPEMLMDESYNPYFGLQVLESRDGRKIPQLTLLRKLDREMISSYELYLFAIDGGNPEQTGTATVTINVLDSNDNRPIFTKDSYEAFVSENEEPGYKVVQVLATDLDHGKNAQIEYSFPSIVNDQDRALFDLNRLTGVITLKAKLDFENQTVHHLTVEAMDGAANPMSAYTSVTVYVEDVNDFAPRIDVKFMDTVVSEPDPSMHKLSNSVLIRENIRVGSNLAFVTILDKDTGINGNVSCALKNSETFIMKSVGEQKSNRYLIETKKELDREAKRIHELLILAWDSGTPPLKTTKTIEIELLDENDNAPTFVKELYIWTVGEGKEPGEELATLTAEDADDGINAQITYSAKPLSGKYVPFDIIPETGTVFFKKDANRLDAENKTESFELNITATDNGVPRLSASTTLVITIADENDNSPQFLTKNYVFRVQEDSPAGLYVGIVSASDEDVDKSTNGKISYRFERPHSAFNIKSDTGQIYFVGNREHLDRELQQQYTFVVVATDHGEEPRTDHCTVEIYIIDINDNPPIIKSPNVTKDIYFLYVLKKSDVSSKRTRSERSLPARTSTDVLNGTNNPRKKRLSTFQKILRIGSSKSSYVHSPETIPAVITQVRATDPDEGENGRVRYTIADGNIYNYFSIDLHSGNLTLQVDNVIGLKNMIRGCHVLKINVKDFGKPIQESVGWANIYVTDAIPNSVNVTLAMKDCMNSSFFPKQFLPPSDDFNLAGLNFPTIIIIGVSVILLLFVICLIFVVLVKCRRKCNHKMSRSYDCKNTGQYLDHLDYQDNPRGSLKHLGSGKLSNRSSFVEDWNPSGEKEEILLGENYSDATGHSHDSAKDSGTGDSMPSDAYHSAAVHALVRLQQPLQHYQRYHPSYGENLQVYMSPESEVMYTDEESNRDYRSTHPLITPRMNGSRCTNECQIRGHSDNCWMPESLQRPSSRMANSASVQEYNEDSLKYAKRSKTPNSYDEQETTRYANVFPYYDPKKKFEHPMHGNYKPYSDQSTETDSRGSIQTQNVSNYPHVVYHKQPYIARGREVIQPSFSPSPARLNTASPAYEIDPYVNVGDNFPSYNSGGGIHYQNYGLPQQYNNQKTVVPEHSDINYSDYSTNVDSQNYYSEPGHNLDIHLPYNNEFAASNLMLSPAFSENIDYKQRFDRQAQLQNEHRVNSYVNVTPSNNESQNTQANENINSRSDGDSSGQRLDPIREEVDADEIVAQIDSLLM